jgi:group I intron endonuclease
MYIYKTTNLINNKIYIGLSTKLVEESVNYYGSGRLINEAIQKYGKENFIKEILERDIEDYDLLCEREIYWIEAFKSHVSFNNYNLTLGGDGSLGLSPDTEWRNKISEGIKNSLKLKVAKVIMSEKGKERWKDPEYRTKMSEIQKGHPSYPNQIEAIKKANSERVWKEPSKEKIRLANSGKSFSDEVNKSKGRPGKSWYYDPITNKCVMSFECPTGYIKGRIIDKTN